MPGKALLVIDPDNSLGSSGGYEGLAIAHELSRAGMQINELAPAMIRPPPPHSFPKARAPRSFTSPHTAISTGAIRVGRESSLQAGGALRRAYL